MAVKWKKIDSRRIERAVAEILAELDKNPPKKLVRPEFPKYRTLR